MAVLSKLEVNHDSDHVVLASRSVPPRASIRQLDSMALLPMVSTSAHGTCTLGVPS